MADGGYATDDAGNKLFVSRPAAAVMPAAPAATAAPAVAATRRARGRRVLGQDSAATRMRREEKRANKAAKNPVSTAPTTMMAKGGAVKKGKK